MVNRTKSLDSGLAYANTPPWKGLGVDVKPDASYRDMMKAAGLDWTVSMRPIQFKGTDGKMKKFGDRFVLARDSDDTAYSLAGSRYHPTQNEEALRFFDRFTRTGKAKMDIVGSLNNGKVIWALAKLGHDFKLAGGDVVKGYLLLLSPHIVGRSLQARVIPMRVSCTNMLTLRTGATRKFEMRFSHVREFNAEEASELMIGSQDEIAKFELQARALAKLKLSREEALKVLFSVYQPTEDKAELKKMLANDALWNPTVRSIMDAYAKAPGAVEGTAWGLLNGATYRSNHLAAASADTRLQSAWLGKESKRTGVLLDTLLQKAA